MECLELGKLHQMSAPSIVIDYPAWMSAISAVLAIGISIVTAFVSKKYYSEYALVSSGGNVLSHKGFKEYGLHVKFDASTSEYTIEFAKTPSYFEVTTQEGGVVILSHASSLSYKLRFVGAGYGSPLIQCNFKIQAY